MDVGAKNGSPRVLVVEDDTVNLELVVALLEEASCQVLTATSAKGVLRLAASERPDLILMDLQLPGMTGYDATRQLKADPATAAIPVVALTADAMKGAEGRAKEAGCDAYLTKPINAAALLDTLGQFLSRCGAPFRREMGMSQQFQWRGGA